MHSPPLGGVPGLRNARAAHQRHRGKHRRVGSAPAEHDVGAGFDRPDVRLRPHQRDDVLAGAQIAVADRAEWRQRGNLAFAIFRDEVVRLLLAVEARDLRRDAEFGCDLERDITRPVDPGVGAAGPARPDQQRNPCRVRLADQDLQVALERLAVHLRHAAREISRAAIGRSGIHRNGAGAAGNAVLDLLAADAATQHPGRDDDADFVGQAIGFGHERGSLLQHAPAP